MSRLFRMWLAAGLILLVPACSHAPQPLPEVVKVPIPVPCEVQQVPPTELPPVTPDMDVFEAARVRMAQLTLILAENERLRAANTDPCPTEFPQ